MSSALWYADFAWGPAIHGIKDIHIMYYSLGAYRGMGTCLGSLVPRPHPKKGERGLVNLDRFLGLAGLVGVH